MFHTEQFVLDSLDFVTPSVAVDLRPAPINPAWIIEGEPTARVMQLSLSRDGTAFSVIWECSPGRFDWFYDREETAYFLEGSLVLDEGLPTERHIGPGDAVFFPAGSHARWHVKARVRKVAFVRRGVPARFLGLLNLLRKMKNRGSPAGNDFFGSDAGATTVGAG
jgi:hypothetical protein